MGVQFFGIYSYACFCALSAVVIANLHFAVCVFGFCVVGSGFPVACVVCCSVIRLLVCRYVCVLGWGCFA